jgi:hypothetical protein
MMGCSEVREDVFCTRHFSLVLFLIPKNVHFSEMYDLLFCWSLDHVTEIRKWKGRL